VKALEHRLKLRSFDVAPGVVLIVVERQLKLAAVGVGELVRVRP
jgi:hypothetical protein